MAITDSDTVLILGAGVSIPFGFPLGNTLIEDISKQIKTEISRLHDESSFAASIPRHRLLNAAKRPDRFFHLPIHGTIARKHLAEDGRTFASDAITEDLRRIRLLDDLLKNQTSETIDDFIVENESYADLTKITIASDFFLRCYKTDRDQLICAPMEERFVCGSNTSDRSRNWIHLFINIVRQGIRSGAVSPKNPVKVITFNYDGILERVLDKQFSNTEAKYPDWKQFINVLHVHGKCGELEDIVSQPAQVCLSWAENINVVNEKVVSPDLKAIRTEAAKIIRDAKEVFVCGFSFAGPNCRLLQLEKPSSHLGERLISFCNYDGNVGLSKSVARYERLKEPGTAYSDDYVFTKLEEAKGSRTDPIDVSDWFKLGYVGELPG